MNWTHPNFGRTRRLVAMITVSALAAACNDHAATIDQVEKDCMATGGTMMSARVGPVCSPPTTDVGRACQDSSECEGLCLGNGQCSAHQSEFGCIDVLVDGQAATICID